MQTNRANVIGVVPCSEIFLANSSELLGDGNNCGFVRDDRLVVYLGYAAKVVPGDVLFFQKNVITNRDLNSEAVSGGTVVDWPDSATKPKVSCCRC